MADNTGALENAAFSGNARRTRNRFRDAFISIIVEIP